MRVAPGLAQNLTEVRAPLGIQPETDSGGGCHRSCSQAGTRSGQFVLPELLRILCVSWTEDTLGRNGFLMTWLLTQRSHNCTL